MSCGRQGVDAAPASELSIVLLSLGQHALLCNAGATAASCPEQASWGMLCVWAASIPVHNLELFVVSDCTALLAAAQAMGWPSWQTDTALKHTLSKVQLGAYGHRQVLTL